MAQYKVEGGDDPRCVPTEKVRPLLLWLEASYDGSMAQVSEVTGVPKGTLQSIKYEFEKHPRVYKTTALKIVEAVMAVRHGDRTWSLYENEAPPRFATDEEKSMPQTFSRWRAAGGKVYK